MGGVYDLTNLGLQNTSGNTETWRFSYSIDTSGFTGTASYIGSVAAKVSSNALGVTLDSAPTNIGAWATAQNSTLSNGGCTGSGSGWVCFSTGNASAAPVTSASQPYTWTFDVTMATGSLLSTASIKANYDPQNGQIMSETVAMTEGTAVELPLFLIGLAGWFLWRKRSLRRCAA
jgi:hypothetical protein